VRFGLYAGAVASILFAAAWALSAAALHRFLQATNTINGGTISGVEGSAAIAYWAVGLLLAATIALCVFGIAVYRYSRGGSAIERAGGLVASACAVGYAVLQIAGGSLYAMGYGALINAIGDLSIPVTSISDTLARYPSAAKELGTGLVLQALAVVSLILFVLSLATMLFGRAKTGKALAMAGGAIIASFFLSLFLNRGLFVIAEAATLAAALAWLFAVSVYVARLTISRAAPAPQ
jgi:hypothetical protein